MLQLLFHLRGSSLSFALTLRSGFWVRVSGFAATLGATFPGRRSATECSLQLGLLLVSEVLVVAVGSFAAMANEVIRTDVGWNATAVVRALRAIATAALALAFASSFVGVVFPFAFAFAFTFALALLAALSDDGSSRAIVSGISQFVPLVLAFPEGIF